jgi:hypothetical protein
MEPSVFVTSSALPPALGKVLEENTNSRFGPAMLRDETLHEYAGIGLYKLLCHQQMETIA